MHRVVSVGIVGALSVLLAAPVAAQDPPFDHVQITQTTVKAGKNLEYEQLVKRLGDAQMKADPTYAVVRYAVGRGGPMNTYMSGRVFTKWAELDRWLSPREASVKALGEAEAAKLLTAIAAVTDSQEQTVASVWKGRNVWRAPASGTQYKLLRVTEQRIVRARLADFNDVVAKRSAAMQKGGSFPTLVRYRRTLGPGNGVTMFNVAYANSYADFDAQGPNLPQAIGEPEWSRQVLVTQQAVATSTAYFLVYRADLSYAPAATSSR
jgi:hypothetical protein